MTYCLLTDGSIIPVVRQQVCSGTEVFGTFLRTLLEGETWQVERTGSRNHMVHIRETTEINHLLQMPPGTEEEQLTLDEVFLLLGRIGHLIQILQTEVHLTDAIPSMLQGMSEFICRRRIQIITIPVQIALVVLIPIAIVTQIEVSGLMAVTTTGIHYLILTPVEGAAPEVGFLVRNTVVGFLHKALEAFEVLERHLRVHIRIR